MADQSKSSFDSIAEANRYRAEYSGHGKALGAAGHREVSFNPDNCEYLREPGQSIAISPGEGGFQSIQIGVMWDNVEVQKSGLFGKLLKKTMKAGVDLDLGVLYEMQDGTRGCIQAFGEKFGNFQNPPYMQLSGDERTGDKEGEDESILINGAHWKDISRILVYLYIYNGVPNWAQVNPKVIVDVPGENDLIVTLAAHNDALGLCAVGGLENVRNGIKLTNYTEYFPGHEEMDRAFGFGLEWKEGKKS